MVESAPQSEEIMQEEPKRERLMHLAFVALAAVQTVVCLASLYDFAKDNARPLKSGVQSVKDTVKAVIGPVFDKFHDVPYELLKFVDRKEVHDVKRQNAALQMQHFVGEEKNDLLDYLRSLQHKKVAELSEPTCPGLQETINSVAHGLLATLSPKIYTKSPHSENETGGSSLDIGKDDCPELVENTSLQFQPLISVSRDYISCAPFILVCNTNYYTLSSSRHLYKQISTLSSYDRFQVHVIGSLSERFRIQARSNATAHNLRGRNGIYTSRRRLLRRTMLWILLVSLLQLWTLSVHMPLSFAVIPKKRGSRRVEDQNIGCRGPGREQRSHSQDCMSGAWTKG